MEDSEIAEQEGPQERPIVERPTCLSANPVFWTIPERHQVVNYLVYLQDSIQILYNELHQAKAIIEGLTAERDRAEAEVKRLTEAIREKDRTIERALDEADAWERTARGI